jgi:hypothetical protein
VRGSRFGDIKTAASIALLAVAPSTGQLDARLEDQASVRGAIGGAAERIANGARYNRAALAVTFPTAPGANTFRTTFDKDELVTVRVSYLFHCALPGVPKLMCHHPAELTAGMAAEEVAQLDIGFLSSVANPRYLLLRAEATLRNQGVNYSFPGE